MAWGITPGPGVAPLRVIESEINTVLTVMRRNSRYWRSSSRMSTENERPSLLHSFQKLLTRVASIQAFSDIPPGEYLEPFLEAIRSADVSGPITGAALSAVNIFVKGNFLGVPDVDGDGTSFGPVADAIAVVAGSVTHCLFEASDPGTDEVVLAKMVQVLVSVVGSKAGRSLSEDAVWEIFQTCFSISRQEDSGELLRYTAMEALSNVVGVLFTNLMDMKPSSSAPQTQHSADVVVDLSHETAAVESVAVSPALSSRSRGENFPSGEEDEAKENDATAADTEPKEKPAEETVGEASMRKADDDFVVVPESSVHRPYSLPLLTRVLNQLCLFIAPMSSEDLTSKLTALDILGYVIAGYGGRIALFPELMSVVRGPLSYYLLCNCTSAAPNAVILSKCFRIIQDMHLCMVPQLKMQLGVFVSNVFLNILEKDRSAVAFEVQEVALEALVSLCSVPSFGANLYANYDCDCKYPDHFESIAKFLCTNALKSNGSLSSLSMHSLNGLLGLTRAIADRATGSTSGGASGRVNADVVRSRKGLKAKLMEFVKVFNESPKKGIEFLRSNGIVTANPAEEVAMLLRNTPGLDKTKIGEYISKKDDFCSSVLTAFADTFNFNGMTIDSALRCFLDSFRLPGESMLIERIMKVFSEKFYGQGVASTMANADVAFVLSYSIIMLNTDLHRAGAVKQKMTIEDFVRNNRKINDGEDLLRDDLEKIYRAIEAYEIKMSGDQGTGEIQPDLWNDLLHRCEMYDDDFMYVDIDVFDKEMFVTICRPFMAAINIIYEHASDASIIDLSLEGFALIARISAKFSLVDVMDKLVVSLNKYTLLFSGSNEQVPRAVGASKKAQMTLEQMFSIVTNYGDHLREGWRTLLNAVLRIHDLNQFNSSLLEMETFNDSEGKPISPFADLPLPQPDEVNRQSSFLSGFSPFNIFAGADVPAAPTEKELQAERAFRDCLARCHLEDIFMDSRFLKMDSLQFLVKTLVRGCMDEYEKIKKSRERPRIGPDHEVVVCLELLCEVTIRNRDRATSLWGYVAELFATILKEARVVDMLLERAVANVFRLCIRLGHKEEVREALFQSLKLLTEIHVDVLPSMISLIAAGTLQVVRSNSNHIKSEQGWSHVFELIRMCANHGSASVFGFDAISHLLLDSSAISESNFNLCVEAVFTFASLLKPSLETSMQALDLTVLLQSRLASFCPTVQREGVVEGNSEWYVDEFWLRYWLPLHQTMCKMCHHRRYELANHALSCLQRALLAPEVRLVSAEAWLVFFSRILTPLMLAFLEPHGEDEGAENADRVEKLRLRACALYSKIFLQHLKILHSTEKFRELWLYILGVLERFHTLNAGELLAEAIPECIKNMLLVLEAEGVLEHRPDDKDSLWCVTFEAIDRIVPTLREEMTPKPPTPVKATPTSEGENQTPTSNVGESDVGAASDAVSASPAAAEAAGTEEPGEGSVATPSSIMGMTV